MAKRMFEGKPLEEATARCQNLLSGGVPERVYVREILHVQALILQHLNAQQAPPEDAP